MSTAALNLIEKKNPECAGSATGRADFCTWSGRSSWWLVGGRVYATAINALTLETYYRYTRVQPAKKQGKAVLK